MQHPGQLDVVEVAALAADEPRVLLAQHPAVADRLLVVVVELRAGRSSTVVMIGGDGLGLAATAGRRLAASAAAPPPSVQGRSSFVAAAQCTERTIVA